MDEQWFVNISKDPQVYQRKSFLGNGLFGIDISNNFGQGYGICEMKDPFPPLFLGGVYADAKFYSGWNNFSIVPASHNIEDNMDIMSDFSQILDMKKAIVETMGVWGDYSTSTEIFLSRSNPNVGFLKIKFTQNKEDATAHHKFIQLIQKAPQFPLNSYDLFEYKKDNDGYVVITSTFKEDRFNIKSEEKYKDYPVVQASRIVVYDGKTNEILPHSSILTIFNEEDADEGEIAQFTNEIEFDTADPSDPFSILMVFGIIAPNDAYSEYSANKLTETLLGSIEKSIQHGYEQEKMDHIKAWDDEIWSRLIELYTESDNERLQRQIISSMYTLGCSFKQGYNNSAGPNGLNGNSWESHVFWDSDLWINLGLVLWAPELSRCITEFRYKTLEGAKLHRQNYVELYEYDHITEGAKYPWQATTSGLETSPPGWDAQEHVTCDVIYGQYLYSTVSGDSDYLENIAFPIAFECCKYLAQRIEKESDGKYHFRGIIPADEHPFPMQVDDNAFTNLYVEKCFKIIISWCKLLSKEYPAEWNNIIGNMFFNFDEENMRVIEFTNYKGQSIKQADTNLLTFPIEYPFSEKVKRNNMEYYFSKLPENHIMMSSAIFSVVACELGLEERANEYFRDLDHHFHTDLNYIASEAPKNNCWPFLTGLGGYLSALMYGFGGIRIREDGLLFSSFLPAAMKVNKLVCNRLYFRDFQFKYVVELVNGEKTFSIQNISGSDATFKLYFRKGDEYLPKQDGVVVEEIMEESTDKTIKETAANESEISYTITFKKDQEILFVSKN